MRRVTPGHWLCTSLKLELALVLCRRGRSGRVELCVCLALAAEGRSASVQQSFPSASWAQGFVVVVSNQVPCPTWGLNSRPRDRESRSPDRASQAPLEAQSLCSLCLSVLGRESLHVGIRPPWEHGGGASWMSGHGLGVGGVVFCGRVRTGNGPHEHTHAFWFGKAHRSICRVSPPH